jgi:uncharacterized protein YneF (UPF0154 family)
MTEFIAVLGEALMVVGIIGGCFLVMAIAADYSERNF